MPAGPIGHPSDAERSFTADAQSPPGEDARQEDVRAGDNVTVQSAIKRVLANSPDLAAAAEAVRAREGDARQASLWPNPQLIGEAENVGGTGNRKNFESAEYTLSFAQPIDLSGKIRRQSTTADYQRRLSGWDYEATRLDLITSTRKAFADLVAAQRSVELSMQLARLADNIAAAVEARVQAGKVSHVETARIEVLKEAARAGALRAEQGLSTARAALAALWGGDVGSPLGAMEGRSPDDAPLPPRGTLEPLLAGAPEAARWADEIARREADLDLARVAAFPDVTVSLGARRFEENDDYALVGGLSVPLPVFDRNQGAIAAATARRTEAERRRAAFLARQRADFQAAYDAVRRAEISVRSLDDRIIPSARSVFASTTTGYQAGKFGLIELLDAQRTLFEAQGQGVEARAALAKARADLERLIAHPAEAAQPSMSGG